jgi:CTP synthase
MLLQVNLIKRFANYRINQEWTKDGRMIKGTDKDLGGTMRLGSYEAKLKDDSLIRKIYRSKTIEERH